MRIRFVLGQYLARGIPQCLTPGPDQFFTPGIQLRAGFIRRQLLVQRFITLLRQFERRLERLTRPGQLPPGQARRDKITNGLAQGAVPVLIEAVSQLLRHRPHAEQVDVSEIQVRLGIEILITQITPADNCHAVIGHPQLVVHTPVLAR